MDPITLPAEPLPTVDVSKVGEVPIRTQIEFTPKSIDPKDQAELNRLEAEIEAQLAGRPATIAAAPPAPVPQAAPAPAPVAPAAVQQPPTAAPAPVAQTPAPAAPILPPDFSQRMIGLQDFLAAEAELRVRPGSVPPVPAVGYPAPAVSSYNPVPMMAPPPAPVSFETRLAHDLQAAPVQTLINLQNAAAQTAIAHAEERYQALTSQLELMQMAQADPYVFTQQGLAELKAVRAQNPWLNNSPTPWTHAYKMLGRNPSGMRPPQVAPAAPALPQAGRPVAPIIPGGAAPTNIPAPTPSISSEADLRAHVEKLFPNNAMAQANYIEQIIARAAQLRGGMR